MGVEFISLSKARGTEFDLRLRVDGAEEQYPVSLTETEGVFALECTAEIQRLFQRPPKECQTLIAAIKQHYHLLKASSELQAA